MDITEALEVAITAEIKAQERYRELATLAEDSETRSLLEQLVRWESDHEKMLRDRLAALKMIKGA